MITRHAIVFVIAVMAGLRPAGAIEPWANERLKATSGVELWLDASRQPAARKAAGKVPLKAGAGIEVWLDASGKKRDLAQTMGERQPAFIPLGELALARFDGTDDHLRLAGTGLGLRELTVFIVAAPHSNLGGFRGLLAANAPQRRDYESGFTIDLGPGGGVRFEQLNVEGRGFGGARDLLDLSGPFGVPHLLEVQIRPADKTVRLFVDGKAAGTRPFAGAELRLDELTVGARYYTNGPGPQEVRGYSHGDIAELLLYGRLLGESEQTEVRRYFENKYRNLAADLANTLHLGGPAGVPLVSVADPPPVQVFRPGFAARELPVDLPNINNIKYRPDGKLVAFAYDGRVFLLSDTDRDGLEDSVAPFWDNPSRLRAPVGMDVTPAGYPLGAGVVVATTSRCTLILDTDGDDKADKEIVVADGWKESGHGVDAVGAVFDRRDGSIYFGLGTGSFTNPYQVDKEGKSHYRLDDEHGSIVRVSKDLKTREIVCTGVRFTIGLAFNAAGELFATDQEGATWLANGNPFDELLHIQRGRHYGFPPRHPKHLPNVIDEPAVVEFEPQHQSTCGLCFNEPVGKGRPFGPAWWFGDAFVAGYSRAKLYRNKLVRTAGGYVGKDEILACLNRLTVDMCVSPAGDLVVATHSGGPDWGSGPVGKGKLYKLRYRDEAVQPVVAWPEPNGVRIAFDRPLDPERLGNLASLAKIHYGRFVRAGDRFESLRPGYEVVHRQLGTPRFELPVVGASLAADRRTLILHTPQQMAPVWYAVTLPGMGRPAPGKQPQGELPQHDAIDLDYNLSGVQADFLPRGAQAGGASDSGNSAGPAWTGWLPSLDLNVARALTQNSAQHDELWFMLRRPGTLRLRTQLDLIDMLRPAVQPGSRIDYEWPNETVTVVLSASSPVEIISSVGKSAKRRTGERYEASCTIEPQRGQLAAVEVTLTVEGQAELAATILTNEDSRLRPLPPRRLLVPWAKAQPPDTAALVRREVPQLKGGSWGLGRKVFFSDAALCSRCHTVDGEGGKIGPDLSNLIHRDYESVLRDITFPNHAINPDYLSYTVVLEDGAVLTGSLRNQGDRLVIGDTQGRETVVEKSAVAALRPAAVSTMPEGLPQSLGPERMRDLLTYLLTPGPVMPADVPLPAPPPRRRAEVNAVLAGAPEASGPLDPLHVVLVAGRKDHGPGEHDYPAWQKAWLELLRAADATTVTTAWDWPAREDFRTAGVIVFYQQGQWSPRRAAELDAYLERGGGLVYIHYAVEGGPDPAGLAQRIGLAWQGGRSRFRHGPLDLVFNERHPVGRNLTKLHLHDESYWQLVGGSAAMQLLGTGVEEGRPQPLFWTTQPGRGRVFVSIPGHYSWTFDDPLFRIILLRGMAWTARQPVDRWNRLATLGVPLRD